VTRTTTPIAVPVIDPARLPRGSSAPDTVPAAPEVPPDPVALAKEAFKRGEARMKVEDLVNAIAEFTRAVELVPSAVEYAVALAWVRFCAASDKQALAAITRETLGKAIRRSHTPEIPRFYLGRVERMLGRDKEALRHFQEVLELQPRHADAAAEIRVIEARLASANRDSSILRRKR
jgi:tetratricopeptide (TPR) repeat protein